LESQTCLDKTDILAISGKSGEGLDSLLKEISDKLSRLSIGAQTAYEGKT
jgi:ABC-type phosphonate transport system ATPase subunit